MKAIKSLRNKVNLQKTGFQTAYRLLDAIIKPVATYGVTVFDGQDDAILTQDHCRRVIGLYWKRWARISKFWSNTDPINHLYDDDFLRLQSANAPNRRPFALFYINSSIIFCVLEVIAMAHPTLWTVPAGSARSHLSRNFASCHVLPSPTFQ